MNSANPSCHCDFCGAQIIAIEAADSRGDVVFRACRPCALGVLPSALAQLADGFHHAQAAAAQIQAAYWKAVAATIAPV